MVYTDKEQVQEGSLLPTRALLAEAERIKTLAHRHEVALAREGINQRDLTVLDQVVSQVVREQQRLEDIQGKPKPLDKDMADIVERALRWRALLIHRAERFHTDDRPSRLKYRRGLPLHNLPERIYEELTLLLEVAKVDLPRFERAQVLDGKFLEMGDDLRYQLLGLDPPDHEAWAKYEQAKRNRRWGPMPKPPPDPPKLPEVMDNAATLSTQRGLLYSHLRRLSAAGQAAFTVLEGKEPRGHEAQRQEFVLRLRPAEYDASLLTIQVEAEGPARRGVKPAKPEQPLEAELAPTMNPAAPAAAPEPERKEAGPKRLVNPGGAPPEITDSLKAPPPGAFGLVRPSTTRGRK